MSDSRHRFINMVMTFFFSKIFFVFLLKFPASPDFSSMVISLITISSLLYHLTKHLQCFTPNVSYFYVTSIVGSTMKISCRNLGRLTINRTNSWSAVDQACERPLLSFLLFSCSTGLSLKGGIVEAVLSE